MQNKTVEDLWKKSRSGARAGSGFRFQDAAAVAAAVDCWAGALEGSAIVPEGLDDFMVESATRTIFVQVKSKIADDAEFCAGELNAIFSNRTVLAAHSSEIETTRAVVIDRPFAGILNSNWACRVSQVDAWSALPQLAGSPVEDTLLTWPDPVAHASEAISRKRRVTRAAALACVSRLMRILGRLADQNAQSERTYSTRARITIGEVDREIDAVLNLTDLHAVEAASREGLAELVSFKDPLPEENYYEGVATAAGHVAAGLVLARDALVDEVVSGLFSARRLLITGPSGAGKSALAFLAGQRTRHACRWIQIRRCSLRDREALLRFVNAQEPDESSPVVLYVDDVGTGAGREWDFVCELAGSRPGVLVLGCVREEDVAVTPHLPECRQVRVVLDEDFARRMWERLKAAGKTYWSFWKEPFEQSRGLLLEYAHMLSRGQRLSAVIEEQVSRRIKEGREAEFEILRIVSAAGSLGASVSSSLLAQRVGLSGIAFARALERLLNEHLVRRTGADELTALHQLRAACVLETCMRLVPGTISQARSEALTVVDAQGMRFLIAGALRDNGVEISDAVEAIAQRIALRPEPSALIGALEGLKIATLNSDAELFVELGRRYHVDPSNYSLIMVALHSTLGDDEESKNSVLGALAAIRKEFKAPATSDLRVQLLGALSDGLLRRLIDRIETSAQVQHFVRSLVGLHLGSRIDAVMGLGAQLVGAKIDEVASTLAMAHELSPMLAHSWVDALGGERLLLDRLWLETPWALRPEVLLPRDASAANTEGRHPVEVRADLLATTGDLLNEPDSIVFDHAARALALAPSAEVVTARPLPLSGEPIAVGGYSRGVKRIGRDNSPSKATVTWNRMLVHAAASKVATEPLTNVMQRRKETLEIAVGLMREYSDARCRGRKLKERDVNRLKALAIIESISPSVPLESPETALSLERVSSLTDPTTQLIVEIRRVCERLGEPKLRAPLLAMDMESIIKSIRSCRDDSRWRYVGTAPQAALDELASLAEGLRQVFLSGVSLGSSHDGWGRGSGVRRARERALVSARHRIRTLATRLSKALSASGVSVTVVAESVSGSRSMDWPEVDICLLVACEDFVVYLRWLDEKITSLQAEASRGGLLEVVPLIHGRVIAQCAMQIFSQFPPMPHPGFAERWGAHCREQLYVSTECASFDQAVDAILSLAAAKELLAEKRLLPEESAFLGECETKAIQALNEIGAALSESKSDAVAEACAFLASVCQGLNENLATETLRRMMPGAESEQVSEIAIHRLALIHWGIEREKSFQSKPPET